MRLLPRPRKAGLRRRHLLALAAWSPAASPAEPGAPASDPPPLGVHQRALVFPADHAAHPDTQLEWWYVTGWLRDRSRAASADRPDYGFQVTFFRARTGLGEASPSRFAARQLLFAHAALTDLTPGAAAGLRQDQRIAREGFGWALAPRPADAPQVVRLGDWSMTRELSEPGGRTRLAISVQASRHALSLSLEGTQPVLLQGDAGYSRKGPREGEASHYYSEPQWQARGRVQRAGLPAADVEGRAWLDHEWSDRYLAPEAVGWEWIGIGLFDGAALTAFRLRRRDESTAWAGGSWRTADGRLSNFGAPEISLMPKRFWTSPRTGVRYPVRWELACPAGHFTIDALADDQELDSRLSTGALYWEGVSALRDAAGRTLGWGYLELTGYGGPLSL